MGTSDKIGLDDLAPKPSAELQAKAMAEFVELVENSAYVKEYLIGMAKWRHIGPQLRHLHHQMRGTTANYMDEYDDEREAEIEAHLLVGEVRELAEQVYLVGVRPRRYQ